MARSSKIQRWIDLLAALLARKYPVPLEELVRDVPGYAADQNKAALRRMFERDKDELRTFGIPIETVQSAEGEVMGYRLDARHFYLPYLTLRSEGRPSQPKKVDRYGYRSLAMLTFEPDELAAVADAAARVRELGDPLLAEHVDSAMRKLACDLPVDASASGSTQVVPARAKARPDVLARLGDALKRRKRVTFSYHTMGTDATGSRTVEPFGLFFLNQHWYLAGRAPDDETIKNYRLNRIGDVEVEAARPGSPDYEIPPSFDLRAHARSRQSWELGAGDAVTASVHFRAQTGAASAAARLGEAVAGHPDRRRFQVRRLDAFARWLLSFAGELEPLAPRELVDEYQGLVRETLEHHRRTGSPSVRPSLSPPARLFATPPARLSASPPAAAQLRRILNLIPALADGETHPVSAVVGLAGVDRDTLFQDIESISERFEAPGGFVAGLQIFIEPNDEISVIPNHFLRPMRLTRGELCALELGLAMLRAERPAEEHRAIGFASERLGAVIVSLPEDDAEDRLRAASLAPAGDLEHLRRLRGAVRSRRKTRLRYAKAADDAPSARIICPYAIVFTEQMWYVVAHCESTDGIRIFRLDRIAEVEQLAARFDSPRDFSLEAIVRDGKAFQGDDAATLRVRYSPHIARWIAEREGKALAEDGSLTVEHPLADREWAVRHLLQYGAEADVLAPQEVRLEVVRRLEAMLTR